MAVAWVAAGARASSTAATTGPSTSPPAGHQADDLLVLIVGNFFSGGTCPTPNTPSGWTQLGTSSYSFLSGKPRTTLFYKKAASSSEASVAVTSSSSVFWDCQMYAWRGVHTTTPVDTTIVWAAEVTTLTPPTPALTTATNNAKMIYIGESQEADSWTTPPAGATEQVESSLGSIYKFIVADETKVTAGTEAADTYTRSSGANPVRISGFALKPVPSFTTWNGSSTVTLAATVTTAGTFSHGTTLTLAARTPGSLTLVPVTQPLSPLTLVPR